MLQDVGVAARIVGDSNPIGLGSLHAHKLDLVGRFASGDQQTAVVVDIHTHIALKGNHHARIDRQLVTHIDILGHDVVGQVGVGNPIYQGGLDRDIGAYSQRFGDIGGYQYLTSSSQEKSHKQDQ